MLQQVLPADALADRVAAEVRATFDASELEIATRELEGLGLAPPGIDLLEILLAFSRGSTLGFYSSLGGAMYRTDFAGARSANVSESALVIHEFTHALQDQNTPLAAVLLGLRENDDLAFTLSAVLEGHAVYTEGVDARARGEQAVPAPEDLMDIEGYRRAFPEMPAVLVEGALRVYPAGYALALAAQERGGSAGIARLLSDPPLSSEQVFAPEKWLSGPSRDLPVFIELGAVEFDGCELIARNTLGAFALGIWAEERAGVPRAAAAGRGDAWGWDGDRYVLFDCDAGTRLAWFFVMDDEAAATQLEAILRRGLDGLDALAGERVVEAVGARLLATVGFSEAERARLWQAIQTEDVPDLGALLEGRPAILERAHALRARAQSLRSLDQREHADRRRDDAQARGGEGEW